MVSESSSKISAPAFVMLIFNKAIYRIDEDDARLCGTTLLKAIYTIQ